MERDAFFNSITVSHETVQKLEHYAELLAEWNQKFNLVADSTLPQIWTRHFLDSAQLYRLLPHHTSSLADMGSGAGFPGLVLAIMGVPAVHLIESIGKKVAFLKHVVAELKLPVTVHQERIEKLKIVKADVVTARALGSLGDLLTYGVLVGKPNATMLFMKGRAADTELTEARKSWTFDCQQVKSLSDESGSILSIHNARYKNAASQQRVRRRVAGN